MKTFWATRSGAVATLALASLCSSVVAQGTQAATDALLQKAHALEVRGRLDMAAQSWQQVLLADPNNTEALGGLARSARSSGNAALATTYLDRLRAINPKDPGITRAAAVVEKQNQDAALAEASKFAQSGQYAQAMGVYRKVFGGSPPPGDWSLAYYETESATEDGRAHAIAGLRTLSDKYPADSRYSIALGRILTYNPKTRVEGRKILARHPADAHANEAIRQSLIWDAPNPASGPELRAYVAKHSDPQLEQLLRDQPKAPVRTTRSARPSAAGEELPSAKPEDEGMPVRASGVHEKATTSGARGQAIEEAYRALNAKHIEDAEQRFRDILSTDPENARAMAGMGYIRMGQSNFGGAMSFLEQAKQSGAHDAGLEPALATARFWFTMGEGAAALNENDLPTAEQRYQAAITMRPTSPEALEGLGGTLLKAQQAPAAVEVYERYVKVKPASPTPWRGLFLAEFGAGSAPQALLTERRIPPAIRAQLMRDPDFLRTLASAYSAVGRDIDAQKVLGAALELPFPAEAASLKTGTQLQYASLLQAANHLDQADGLYRQILAADPVNSLAWQGLIRVEHAMKQDAQAVQTLQSMPPDLYEAAMRDTGFETTIASIYQEGNKPEVAQQILERAITQQTSANQRPSVPLELQLAGVYLARNNPQRAYPIYRQVLTEDPNRTDAWKGMLAVLHSSGRDGEALAQAQQIPQPIRAQLEGDVEYLQTMGAVYNSLGQPREAMVFINRVQQHYSARHAAAPSDIDIQDAWLLFNGSNDAGLYRQLMLLGGRQDLTDEQRRTVQTIWTSWAVRRANQDAAAGNGKRSLAILNAAAKSFPENPGVLRALASGYARNGLPKQAVAIFRSQDMTAASAGDYKAAVGAALSAGDMKSAETWLRFGLEAYPRDAQMLTLGAKFEQARGNSARAADYFRASLAALPASDPGAELAGELSQPALAAKLPSATQSQDLATLLGAPATNDLDPMVNAPPAPRPYLPNYSNAYGEAPVQLPGPSGVVPSYMANPGSRPTRATGAGTRSTVTDSIPQAAMTPPAELPVLTLPSASTYLQAAPPPEQPAVYASILPPLSPTTVPAPADDPPAPRIRPQSEIYGPYAQSQNLNTQAGYTPSAVPVQLGDAAPRNDPTQREITDVLPTARYLPNGGNQRAASRTLSGLSRPAADDTDLSTHNAQYSPASKQPAGGQGDSSGQQYPQPDIIPGASHPVRRRTRTSPLPSAQPSSSYDQTRLPPLSYPGAAQPLSTQPYPTLGAPAPEGNPPTDAELAAKDLPPLRGGYDPHAIVATVPTQLSPRQQTELELATLEAGYSAWIGGTGNGRYRSGTAGIDRLVDIEAPVEASAVLGKSIRATVVAQPVFLNSGAVDTAVEAAALAAGNTIPVIGTLRADAIATPTQQFASGIGGEFQLNTTHLGLAVGYTPYEFLVRNVTGRLQLRTANGHLTFFGDRDPVKDTQLSYAGLRDPGTISAVNGGTIWGGVISTTGGVRIDLGNERSGLYLSGDGGTLTGYNTLDNKKYEGSVGAYFRVHHWPGYGNLNVGGSFFAMHYDHNERGLSFGNGGYFSPNVYFLASLPVTFNGYYKSDFHYNVTGTVGIQTFQEDAAPYFPLNPATGSTSGNPQYPVNSNTGLNYALNSEGAYRIADHWYTGAFLAANNTNNYNTTSGGFFVRYLFRQQVPTESYPTGIFPVTGIRPLRVP